MPVVTSCVITAEPVKSIGRISGDNELYSIYPNGKGYVHIFFIFGLSATRPRDPVRPRPERTYLNGVVSHLKSE